MASYSPAEYCEMVLVYGECNRNARAAARLYAQRFPQGRRPTHQTILDTVGRLRETGSTANRPRTGRPHREDVDIVAYVLAHPHVSTREVATMCGLSNAQVHRIVQRHGVRPYRVFQQHALYEGDHERRLDWCNYVLNALDESPDFLFHVLWTDEAKFTRDGVVNTQNQRYWAMENPHWTRDTRHQVQWSTNVWCGIWGDHIVGPVFYDDNLTGGRFLDLLRHQLDEWLESIPLRSFCNMWMQLDGAPAHRCGPVSAWLTARFGEQWIGPGGPVPWPPRSPDLTPLDFFLWGYVKSKIYETPPQHPQDLRQRIRAACATIDADMLAAVRRNIVTRVQHCIVAAGGHFEFALS